MTEVRQAGERDSEKCAEVRLAIRNSLRECCF